MTILVTNDDGYSIGLQALLEVAKGIDKSSYAVIPHRQRSAVAMSLTLHKPLRTHKREAGIYEFSGNPADCVLFSIYSREVKKPSLILSGVNFGDNCGVASLICSGTIGACWTAGMEGIPSIAFSMFRTNKEWRDSKNWGDTGKMKEKCTEIIKLLKPKLKPFSFFSVTLPNDLSKSKIIFSEKMQMQRFKTFVQKRTDPSGVPYYWIYGDFSNAEKGTDLYEVAVNKNIVISHMDLKKIAEQGGI